MSGAKVVTSGPHGLVETRVAWERGDTLRIHGSGHVSVAPALEQVVPFSAPVDLEARATSLCWDESIDLVEFLRRVAAMRQAEAAELYLRGSSRTTEVYASARRANHAWLRSLGVDVSMGEQ